MANLSPSFVTITPPVGPTFSYLGEIESQASGAVLSGNVNIGTAAADRLIVVQASCQGGHGITSVVVNGVALTQNKALINPTGTGYSLVSYSGVVASGSGSQNVTVTWASGTFQDRTAFVWSLTGLSSTTVKNVSTAGDAAACALNVTAGDYLMSIACHGAAGAIYTGNCTENPAAERQDTLATFVASANWVAAATNAAFSIELTGTQDAIAVSFK